MDGVFGALAGGGMLILIGLLIGYFMVDMGWLSREKAKWMGRCFLTVLGACVIYRLAGALIYFIFYGPVGNVTEYQIIFRSPGLEKIYALLQLPRWEGLLTGLFAYLGYGLGSVLFGQYALGGEVLAFLCTLTGFTLLTARLQGLFGRKTGEQMAFLMLCMPFSVFFFLPGWAPLGFLLGAAAIYFLGKLLPAKEFVIPEAAFCLLVGLLSMLSAAMVYALAMGRLM